MTELEDVLAELGLSMYLRKFLEEGFESWYTVLDIRESDFDVLGVKVSHRRKLQRKIADFRGLSSERASISPWSTSNDADDEKDNQPGGSRVNAKESRSRAKRKYKRQPKSDKNAPRRPLPAYLVFSNILREEFKEKNLSFTEMAKLAGNNWRSLSSDEREAYAQQASTAKGRYNNRFADYKTTDNYRQYTQYLVGFKARQLTQLSAIEADAPKRPRIEAHRMIASHTFAINCGEQLQIEASSSQRVKPSLHNTRELIGDGLDLLPPVLSTLQHSISIGDLKCEGSSNPVLAMVLPGDGQYILGGAHQALWNGGQLNESMPSFQQLLHILNAGDCRASQPKLPAIDHLHLVRPLQHAIRMEQNHLPPLLICEPINKASISFSSTSSPTLCTPRTPVESLLEDPIPRPSIYSQEPIASFENRLPHLQQTSLSPRIAMDGARKSPKASQLGYNDYEVQYSEATDHRRRDFMPSNPAHDTLDPISALIKAGEIINRNN